jgi:hypothetical protein
MTIKKIVSKSVGLIQVILGGLTVFFGFILFNDFFNLQFMLGLSSEYIGLYLWILATFGILSTISGLILFYEK